MGGFLMAIMIGLGVYAWREDMNITMICYWGFLCLINGAFDLVKVIDYMVKLKGLPLFSDRMPTAYNLGHLTMILIPVSTLLGAPLAWYLYKDYTEGTLGGFPEQEAPMRGAPMGGGGGGLNDQRGGDVERVSLLGGRRSSTTFRAFE